VLRTYPNLKLLGKNPKMICGFEGRETGEQAAAGVGGGTRSCRGLSAQRRAARGDGCPVRRPSGSAAAAAAPLGLRAGPEPQRSGGSGGLTILPRGLVPSNLHRPRGGSACGSSLTFPAGGASACCPGPGSSGGDVGRVGKEGGRLDLQRQRTEESGGGEGAAGAGAAAARAAIRYPRGSPSMQLSLSYCQYHQPAESIAHTQPNFLPSSTPGLELSLDNIL
jgi:hypothetical protein